jgi:hypothetical protein
MIPRVNPNQPFPTPASLEANLFPDTSRYYGTKVQVLHRPDGRAIAYLARRMLPPEESLVEFRTHTVVEGDRLDLLANQHLGDELQFWRICDANSAMDPEELTATLGRQLRITLPEGVSGATRA